jgi:flagellar P-ring protein precursor FlgI
MKKHAFIISLLCCVICASAVFATVKVKVRDLVSIDGLRENQVFGFGLVVGLPGTGDTKLAVTQNSLRNVLKNMGMEESELSKSKNIASVLITAKLPPFVNVGDRIDVTISSIGDAKSLEGGVLIQSPLKGGDDTVYVVAQGPVVLSQKQGKKGITTVGYVVSGGIIEHAMEPDFVTDNSVSLILHTWDFAAADQIIKAAQETYPESKPVLSNDGKIKLNLPKNIPLAEFISGVQNIEITPSSAAKVVINEKDGTIVMGGDVRISEVMVSKDGITVKVKGSDKPGTSALIKDTSSVKDLVETMNFIGLSTADIIAVLKALKEAGALHAELIVR